MDWIWGGRKPKVPDNFNDFLPPNTTGGSGPPDGGDNRGKKDGGAMEAYRFDSSALERAAKAAKELESSPNTKEYLELSRQQEITRQQEIMMQAKEFEAQTKQMELQMEKVRAEERLKQMKEQANLDKQKVQYQDQLARQRYDDQVEQQRRLNEETLRKQEESTAKQEAQRRATLEHELEKRAEHDIKRIEREVFAKGKVERENQDLTLEQIRLKAKENRQKALDTVSSVGALIGNGLHTFLGDKGRVTMAVGGIVSIAAGYLAAKGGISMGYRFLEARLVKPSLVRETSRLSLIESIKHPIETVNKIKSRLKPPSDNEAFSGVILPGKIETVIRDIALEARQCRQSKGTYRNTILYGPPGTGKTMFARILAQSSGMDYAIMAGGDVQIMDGRAVAAIHKLFDWTKTSRRGLVLFIDEAETFLIRRDTAISQELRDALSAFLSRTGEPNSNFMLILTSNEPTIFDKALINRVQNIVEFPLPGLPERVKMLAHYYAKYILERHASGKWRMKLHEDLENNELVMKYLNEIGAMTEGMSGRELAHLVLDWQRRTIVQGDAVLTKDIMIQCTERALEKKNIAVLWEKSQMSAKPLFSAAVVNAARVDGSSKNNAPSS